ncbi:MAG: hypothetical protein ACKOEO_12670 [Planctomycetaceae bacterium]
MLNLSNRLWLMSIAAVLITPVGCGSDPNANTTELTPEVQEKIKAEDAAVEAEEGGRGAVR